MSISKGRFKPFETSGCPPLWFASHLATISTLARATSKFSTADKFEKSKTAASFHEVFL